MLKCYVKTAGGHLLTVFDKLLASHVNSIRLIMWRYGKDKSLYVGGGSNVNYRHLEPTFAKVRGKVSRRVPGFLTSTITGSSVVRLSSAEPTALFHSFSVVRLYRLIDT